MSFLKALFTKKQNINLFTPPSDFANDVRKAISLIGQNEGSLENAEVGLLAKNGQVVELLVSAKSLTVNEDTYLFFAMREKR